MSEQTDALSAALDALIDAVDVAAETAAAGEPDHVVQRADDAVHAARAAVERLARPAAPAEAQPMALHIIRAWPEGFAARLEHVWRDLVGFVPNYKLYDLHRVLAEFGFTMLVYEGAAPAQPVAQPQAQPPMPCGECHIKPGERCDVCGALEAGEPQAQTPLSEERLRKMRETVRQSPDSEHTVWWLLLCRAVEQAHGIGEQR